MTGSPRSCKGYCGSPRKTWPDCALRPRSPVGTGHRMRRRSEWSGTVLTRGSCPTASHQVRGLRRAIPGQRARRPCRTRGRAITSATCPPTTLLLPAAPAAGLRVLATIVTASGRWLPAHPEGLHIRSPSKPFASMASISQEWEIHGLRRSPVQRAGRSLHVAFPGVGRGCALRYVAGRVIHRTRRSSQQVSNSQFEPPLAIATGLNRNDDRARNSLNAFISWSRSGNSSK
jgi:hypothetical protein